MQLQPRKSRLALGGGFLFAFLAFLGGFSVTTIIFKSERYGWSDAEIGIYNAVYTGFRASTLVVSPMLHRLSLSPIVRLATALFSSATVPDAI